MKNLIREIRKFNEERDWEQFHSPKNLAMALSVEVAEVVEHFQWLTQEQSNSLSKEKLASLEEELADVLIYLTQLADVLEIDLVEESKKKIEKNRAKYPIKKSKGVATKYTELQDE